MYDYIQRMTRLPVRIDHHLTERLYKMYGRLAQGRELPEDVRMFACDVTHGYARVLSRVIIVPTWAVKKDMGAYGYYYLAHELAHIAAFDSDYDYKHIHDAVFMREFKRICPENIQHYELRYKPRAAKAAGITKRQLMVDAYGQS